MVRTVNPAEVFSTGESDSSDDHDTADQGPILYTLNFPDMLFKARKFRTVLGRGRQTATADTEEPDGPLERHDMLCTDEKRLQRMEGSESSDEEDGLSPTWEDAWVNRASQAGHQRELTQLQRVTAVGGIGGPQSPSEDPDEDLVAVHPAVEEETGQLPVQKVISRRHMVIFFDEDHGWVVEVLGKNGIYINEQFHKRMAKIALDDGDLISLAGVGFYFNTADIDEEDDESWDSDQPEENSQDFRVNGEDVTARPVNEDEEDDDDNEEDEEDEEAVMRTLNGQELESIQDSESDVEGIEEDEAVEEQPQVAKATKKSKPKPKPKRETPKTLQHGVNGAKDKKAEKRPPGKKSQTPGRAPASSAPVDPKEPLASVEVTQKRRGPGRPPADGVMSKRERRERQKALEAGVPYGDPLPTKLKRPRTDSVINGEGGDASGNAKKAKKLKRDPSAIGGDEPGDDTAGDVSAKGELTPPQQPRAPSPKESDFPPDKLAKPEETYQGLLHVVLSESTRPLALPQIYEAIKNKWPYFRFKPDTKGWESSVRHNLQSSQCFLKAGKAGKGYLWTVNPDVPFERKARKPSPPANSIPAPYQPPRPSQHGMHLPVHGLYNQPQFSLNAQQASFMNGQRPLHLPQPLQQPTFAAGQNTAVLGQQPHQSQQASSANGQHPPVSIPPSQPTRQQQAQPLLNNYSSPYSLDSAPQAQGHQGNNSRLPDGNFTPSGGAIVRPPLQVNANSPNPLRPNSQTTNAQRPMPNGAQAQNPSPRIQTPVPVGKQNAQPGGPVPREPLAADEIRQGRTPAVVGRFMAQLRRISGNDAERTVRQAELALDWITKHPDSDNGIEQEQNVAKSMVTVLRNLIKQQSANPQAIQKDGFPTLNRASQTPAPASRPVHALPTPATPATAATGPPAVPAARVTQQSQA